MPAFPMTCVLNPLVAPARWHEPNLYWPTMPLANGTGCVTCLKPVVCVARLAHCTPQRRTAGYNARHPQHIYRPTPRKQLFGLVITSPATTDIRGAVPYLLRIVRSMPDQHIRFTASRFSLHHMLHRFPLCVWEKKHQ